MIPARVIASGMVTAVNKDDNSFLITLRQEIDGGSEEDSLTVRALLEKGPKWPDPVKRLPSAQGFVSFAGKLFLFEEEQARSRPVVSLDSITYLRIVFGGAAGTVPSVPPSANVPQTDDQRMATRMQNMSRRQNLTQPASTSTSPPMRKIPVADDEEECEDLL